MTRLLLGCLFLAFSVSCYAQLTVNTAAPNNSPAHLVQNVLLGNGVTAFNVTFSGDSNLSLGVFDNTGSIGPGIGMNTGIVMSTGLASQVGGPQTFVSTGNGLQAGDPDLTVLAQNQTRDQCVIEFDFVPTADSIKFHYAFGSTEYPNFVCSPFNDVFGFFIAGPGISGPFSAPVGFPNGSANIALVPGTNTPVAINSINSGIAAGNPANCDALDPNWQNYSVYYVDNDSGPDVAFFGHTVVLTAEAVVIPCDTYHIKLAIADAGDFALDSGVFLEAKSFSSGQVIVDASPSYNTFGTDTNLYEGCGTVTLNFQRFTDFFESDTVYFGISGTADTSDHSAIPDSILFLPGDTTVQLVFDVTDDGITEGTETFIISIFPDPQAPPCILFDTVMVTLYFNDRPAVTSTTFNDTTNCIDSAVVTAAGVTGIPEFQFLWETGDSTGTILFPSPAPSLDTTIFVTVTDACEIDSIVDSVQIFYIDPPFVTNGGYNDTIVCGINSVTLVPTVVTGSAPFSPQWSSGDTTFSLTVPAVVSTDSTFTVQLVDFCTQDTIVDTFQVFQDFPPLLYTVKDDTIDCTEDSIILDLNLTNSSGVATFSWNFSPFGPFDTLVVFPSVGPDSNYFIRVIDSCHTFPGVFDTITVYKYTPPLETESQFDTLNCLTDSIFSSVNVLSSHAEVSYFWNTGDTTDSIWGFKPTLQGSDSLFILTLVQCETDTVMDTLTIHAEQYAPINVTLTDTTVNCPGDPVNLNAGISGGFIGFNFSWSPAAQVVDPLNNPTTAAPDTTTTFTIQVTDTCGIDTATATRTVFVPQFDSLLMTVNGAVLPCPDDSAILVPSLSGGAPGTLAYTWDLDGTFFTNDSLFIGGLPASTVVSLTVTDQCNNSVTDTAAVTIFIWDPMTVLIPQAASVIEICPGDPVSLSAIAAGGDGQYQFTWLNENDTVVGTGDSVTTILPNSQLVTVQLIDGCQNFVEADVQVDVDDCALFFPNVITPNADGLNEYFWIRNLDRHPNSHFVVFNRWGVKVFESDDYRNNWDGYVQHDGIYFYMLELASGEQYHGSFTVLHANDRRQNP